MTTSILAVVLRTEKKATGDTTETSTALDKAQLRRAQVRKAQKQHRERKANYVKQLEGDVTRYRDLILEADRDVQRLKQENDAMKAQLQQPPIHPYSLGLDDITMTIGFDDVMNAPAFSISSSPSESQYQSSNQSLVFPGSNSPVMPETTPDQTQEAINFILALEHICRNHFDPSPGKSSGHALMASSLALQRAPPEVFTAADNTAPLLRTAKAKHVSRQGDCSWQATGLTLHSLYGLACSISYADLEITPVQAWFELAGSYPLEVLLRRDVLDGLKRELAPMVRCLHFGAVIERDAFDSVVGRILGGAGFVIGEGGEPDESRLVGA